MPDEFAQADQWNPPIPNDESQYSFSSSKQTRGGHVFEVDDTLGNERIGEHHKSGTSRVVKADGSSDLIIVGDAWITIVRAGHILINGEANVTIANTVKLHCKKLEVEVEGDMNTTVHGNYNLKVDKNYMVEIVGDCSEKIVGDKKMNCKNYTPTVSGGVEEKISNGYTSTIGKDFNVISTEAASITGGTSGSFKSSGPVSIGGSTVGIDGASTVAIAALGSMTVLTPLVDITSPTLALTGTMVALGDVMTMLTGAVTLATHKHKVAGVLSTPPIIV